VKVLWIARIRLKVFSERENIIIDGACAWKNIVPPYFLQNFFTAYYFALSLNEKLQKHDFLLAYFRLNTSAIADGKG
jgi:hypothetical protein